MAIAGFKQLTEQYVPSIRRNCAKCGKDFVTSAKGFKCSECRVKKIPLPKKVNLKPTISSREMQIITLIKQAKANKEIANLLHLEEGTVKEYLHNIYKKLNVNNRVGLALREIREDEIQHSSC